MKIPRWIAALITCVTLTAASADEPAFVPLKLGQVRGLAFDRSGNLYVPDLNASKLYKVSSDGEVSTVPTGPIKHVHAVAISPNGTIYIVETEVSKLHTLIDGGSEQFLPAEPGTIFLGATTAVFDAAGNLYVGENDVNIVRKVTSDGKVSVYAGAFKQAGNEDGSALDARFSRPRALAIDRAGNLYLADEKAHVIRKISTDGKVTTIAGTAGEAGSVDGTGPAARFRAPRGVAVGPDGNIYVMDTNNHAIRRVTPEGGVTTFAGVLGEKGFADGSGATARFSGMRAAAFDAKGNLFVADSDNSAIRRVTPAGVVSTVIGVQPPAL